MTNRRARRAAARGGKSGERAERGEDPVLSRQRRTLFDAALGHLQAGRSAEAAEAFGQVLAIDPHHADSLINLGILAFRADHASLAESFFSRAIQSTPSRVEAHFNLGLVLQSVDRLTEAVASLDRAVALNPSFAEAHLALGNAHHLMGRLEEAVAAFGCALAIKPSYAEAHMNLGNALREQSRLTEAIESGGRAATLSPGSAVVWRNLALSRQDEGLVAAAVSCLDRALALVPEFAEAQSGRLFCLNYHPSLSAMAVSDEHRRWGERRARTAPATADAFDNHRDPDRRLRIGLVSGDLHKHPVGYFLKAVLQHRSRTDLEIFCYSNGRRRDAMTESLRRSADHWRTISALTDLAAEQLIRSDQIDILIDLSGHAASNRLLLFNRRAAPVQASWLGYVATTGLPAIDYVISDADTAPRGSEPLFTEKIVRLPFGRFCYAPPEDAPEPEISPQRPLVFGSFNDVMKLNDDVIGVWARLLEATPEALLRLKWMAFADADVRARIIKSFANHAIGPERITFSSYSPHASMMAEYAGIDVALDPFPFGGGLTSCEALWMGVPVVTLPLAQPGSRQTLAFLRSLGLDDLAARSPDEYVAIAGALIADKARRLALRRSLRPLMQASPLTRGELFTPGLESALRVMWRRWCAGEAPSPYDVP